MRLRFPLLAVALVAAAAHAQPAKVILVRHAEKAAAPAADPPLTEAGAQRAIDLAKAIAGDQVTTVITTQFARTQLTAKPVTDALHRQPIIVRAGGSTAAHVDSVVAAVKAQPAGSVVLVVGHSNTIPAIVAALGGPRLPDLCDPQYSHLFRLDFTRGPVTFTRITYGAADPPDADKCAPGMR